MTKITVYDSNNNVKAAYTRVISALFTRTLSGECSFEFTVTSDMAADMGVEMAVNLEMGDIMYRFRIIRISKSISSGITICKISCEHISYRLNDPEYDVEKFEFRGSVTDCLTELLKGTPLISGECEPAEPVELLINQQCTRRAALMQLVGLCEGELDYDENIVVIRSHLGSREYRDIMDGKNITDLTVDIDSRSNTYNYGLKLYKKLDFTVGDNVHIVFSPFYLDTQTRIISMSINPFNRSEISIEVGDYVPSISDNLYRAEQAVNEVKKNVSDATAAVKTCVNETDMTIENKEVEIFRLSYNAVKTTYAAFITTINFTVKTAGELTFILKKDENEKMRYTEQFAAQDYARTYSYPFVSEDGVNVIILTAISPDSSAVLPKLKSWGYVIGAYIVGEIPWDGYIRVRESVPEFSHARVHWEKHLETIKETMLCTLPEMHTFAFKETPKAFVYNVQWNKKHEEITERLPFAWEARLNADQPLKAWNTSDTEVYIELRNPVTTDGTLNPEAFSMSITNAEQTIINITPAEAYVDELSDLSDGQICGRIQLVFTEKTMRESVQEIALFYYSTVGNLIDAFSGTPCEDFRTAFNYTAH